MNNANKIYNLLNALDRELEFIELGYHNNEFCIHYRLLRRCIKNFKKFF